MLRFCLLLSMLFSYYHCYYCDFFVALVIIIASLSISVTMVVLAFILLPHATDKCGAPCSILQL